MTTPARPTYDDHLFVGTHGHVLAVDQTSGRTLWDTSLPGTGYSVVSIVVEGGRLLCASGGKVFALDPTDGSILWENALPGMGTGVVFLTTSRSHGAEAMLAVLAAQAEADAATAASAAT